MRAGARGYPLKNADKDEVVRAIVAVERGEAIFRPAIAQGHSNTVISNKLSLGIKTVQNYVSSILTKLQVADRSQAIVPAREAGSGKKDGMGPAL